MDLLFDTHVLVWTISGDDRLSATVRDAIGSENNRVFVSAVVAFEFVDLEARGRFPAAVRFSSVCDRLAITILDYPGDAWRLLSMLPDFHRDPVDRMLIAHALHDDLTLVTADAAIRRYPVRTLW